MKKTAHGTLFTVPLPDGTFVCGRIMLDIFACVKRRLFPVDSPLPGLGKALLVEMYSSITVTPTIASVTSPKLICGAYVDTEEIGKSWQIIGQAQVNPKEVEFPESIIGFMHPKGDGEFQCGEIKVPLPLEDDSATRIGEFKRRHSSCLWGYTCLRALGQGSEVPKGFEGATLAGSDLRHSKHRASIYKHLPFPMKMSYYEKQKLMGFDVERLYRS